MKATWRASALCPSAVGRSFKWRCSLQNMAVSVLAVALGALPLLDGAAWAGQVGNWQFNSTLSNEISAAPLVVNGDWTATYVDATINGNPATVLSFPAFTNTQSLQMPNQVGANGGGTNTNVWSIVMDVNFPSVTGFKALWQTDQNLGGSDGDFFINGGGIGISSNYHGVVPAGEWTRIAVTIAPNGPTMELNKYINGALVGTTVATGGSGAIDARHSVGSVLNLFADEDGETGAGFVNNVAYYDHVLTASDVRLLGAATAVGIPAVGVPEPTSIALGVVGATAALLVRRRRS